MEQQHRASAQLPGLAPPGAISSRRWVAFEFPCSRAHDTVHERYKGYDFYRGRLLSSIVTVNK
jgi:hypothetical protein